MDKLLKIFEGKVELSEDIKEKITVLWTSLVEEKTAEIEGKMESYISEEVLPFYEEKTQEYLNNVVMEQVNAYVTEAVASFSKEKEEKLKAYAVTEANGFVLDKIAELFEGLNIKVPEGKEDELKAAVERAAVLESKVDGLIRESTEAKVTILKMEKEKIISEMSSDLSEMQKEKFESLVENVDTNDLEEYSRKASILIEAVTEKKEAVEDDDQAGKAIINEEMDDYTRKLLDSVKSKNQV